MNRPQDRHLTRYLLGDLDESDRVAIEEEFLARDDFFEEMLAVEDELIDAYVLGALSPHERALFESRYLTTEEGRQRVQTARRITGASATATTLQWRRPIAPFRAFARGALAAAAVAILVLAVWLFRGRSQPGTEVPVVGAPPTQQSAPDPAEPKVAQDRERRIEQPPSAQRIASFVLSPALVRSEGKSQRLEIPHDATLVRLRLELETLDYNKNYRAELQTAEGDTIWRGLGTVSRDGVTVEIPSKVFAPRDFVLLLSGRSQAGAFESAGEYFLRVAKK